MLFLASALTFDLLLAALPFVVLLLAVLGYVVHAGQDDPADLGRLIDQLVPAAGGARLERAEDIIRDIVASRGRLSLLGLPLFLWFATRLFSAARVALNHVFDTEESRPYLLGKLLDFVLVVVALALLTANAALTVFVVDLPWLGRFIANLSTFTVGAVLFFIIYTVAPSRRIRWDTAVVAAVVASLGFEVAKMLYGLYLTNFATVDRIVSNANAIAVLLFVLWLYYTTVVFLFGGEVAETYDLLRRQREQRAILT